MERIEKAGNGTIGLFSTPHSVELLLLASLVGILRHVREGLGRETRGGSSVIYNERCIACGETVEDGATDHKCDPERLAEIEREERREARRVRREEIGRTYADRLAEGFRMMGAE